jgi:hypothetical protein
MYIQLHLRTNSWHPLRTLVGGGITFALAMYYTFIKSVHVLIEEAICPKCKNPGQCERETTVSHKLTWVQKHVSLSGVKPCSKILVLTGSERSS